MNKQKIVAIVAYILLVVGIIGIAWSVQPSKSTDTFTIPQGEGYYMATKVSFWMSGHISGSFEVQDGSSIEVRILDSAQYNEYSYDLDPSSALYTVSGASGNFSADMPSTSTYYVTFNHASGYNAIAQDVKVTIKVSGLDLKYLIIGIVLLVVGVVLAVMSRRMKEPRIAFAPGPPPEPKPTDVTMFGPDRKT